MNEPLILTLKLDAATHEFFDGLRQRYFPPERNFLAAHLTLFHHLPGTELDKIRSDLQQFCRAHQEFPLNFPRWRFLGKGVAVAVESDELIELRMSFARLWNAWLRPQDRQKFQPHITVQNKVAPEKARRLYDDLAVQWQPTTGLAPGLSLWHYLGAHWKLEADFLFGS